MTCVPFVIPYDRHPNSQDYESGALGHRDAMSNWMSKLKPIFQATGATLFDISLVGSHDTVTYDMSTRVMAGDVPPVLPGCTGAFEEGGAAGSLAQFFGLNIGNQDCEALVGFVQNILGAIFANDCSPVSVLGVANIRNPACVVRDQAVTQGITIMEQLDAGVRFLDFRVAWRGDDQPVTSTSEILAGGLNFAEHHDITNLADYGRASTGMADFLGLEIDKGTFEGGRESVGRGWYGVHSALTKRPAMFYLVQLRAWLDSHPDEIVVLWLTQHGDCTADYGSSNKLNDGVFPQGSGAFAHTTQDIRNQLWDDITSLFDGYAHAVDPCCLTPLHAPS